MPYNIPTRHGVVQPAFNQHYFFQRGVDVIAAAGPDP